MNIDFSFIVPAYNVEEWIERCIDSLLALKDINKEIIIINDGSTDKTLDILKSKYMGYENIRLISQENQGLSCARNEGMAHASGKYLLFVDSDDSVRPEMEEFLKNFSKYDAPEVVYFRSMSFFVEENDEVEIERYALIEDRLYSGDEIMETCTFAWIPNEVWLGVFSYEFLRKNHILFLPGVLYEDNAFWFDVMKNAKRVYYTNEVLYNYSIRPGSIVFSAAGEKNIRSVLKTISYVYAVETPSKVYLTAAAEKLPKLMHSCEKKLSTSKMQEIDNVAAEIIEEKKKVIIKLKKFYDESDISLLKPLFVFASEYVYFLGIYDEEMQVWLKELRAKLLKNLTDRLYDWPLIQNKRKIGIYGSGRNSDVLLNLFEKLVGPIKNDYIYIDTYKDSYVSRHLNHYIVNLSDIRNAEINDVIICSNKYEQSMKKNLEDEYPEINTYLFYKYDDFIPEGVLNSNYCDLIDLFEKTKKRSKRFIVLLTPEYPNVGDHLIAEAIKLYLERCFPDVPQIEVTNDDYNFYKVRLRKLIKKDDVLVITGGGFFGSLWREAHFNELLDIVKTYKDNKIWIMPQSVHYSMDTVGTEYLRLTKEVFADRKTKICLRERFSYNELLSLGFDKNYLFCAPDIVFSYRSKYKANETATDIGCFIRSDKESVINQAEWNKILEMLQENKEKVVYSSMQYPTWIIRGQRKYVIEEKLEEISNYRIVFTDQLHCMIVCSLIGVKCVAFKSLSHKMEGVYDWIKDLNYIGLAENFADAKTLYNKYNRIATSDGCGVFESDFLEMKNFFIS